MSDLCSEAQPRLSPPRLLQVWVLAKDFSRLLIFTVLLVVYALVFRNSRMITSETCLSPWMFATAARSTWGILMLSQSVLTAVLLWRVNWRCGYRPGFPDLRVIVIPTIFVLAWPFSVYEYNYFVNQSHLADRAGIVVLALLSAWRPMFLGFFLTQLGIVIGHLNYPLSFSWTDKSPLIDVLLLAQIYVFGARFSLWRSNHFLWGSIWVLAMHYLRPAIGKLEIGWLQHNEIENLVQGAIHQNSWLCFGVPEDVRTNIVMCVSVAGSVLMLFALLVELVPLMYFSSRLLMVTALASAAGMHIAIFASSGIFFWKWIVLDVVMIIAVLQIPRYATKKLFRLKHHAVFVLFLVTGCLLNPVVPTLAWFDAPVCQRFQIEIVGESGRVYQAVPSQMAPFDLQFAQGRLFFADPDPMVVDCFGSCTSVDILSRTKTLTSEDGLTQLQAEFGERRFDTRQSHLFQSLLMKFVLKDPSNRSLPVFDAILDPPQHIWTFPAANSALEVWNWQEPAQEIVLRKVTAKHRSGQQKEIQDKVIMRLPTKGS